MITINEIEAKIKEIKRLSTCDYEAAHGEQDDLSEKIFEAIAAGVKNPALYANMALRVYDMDFPRHCA